MLVQRLLPLPAAKLCAGGSGAHVLKLLVGVSLRPRPPPRRCVPPCQPAAAVPVKRYKRRMEQQIGNCVQDMTAPLLQKCSQLAAAGENTDKKTNEILEEAHNFVMQVRGSPCDPAAGKLFGCCA